MFTVITAGTEEKVKWGKFQGFPWFTEYSGEGFEVYQNLIYSKSHLVKFDKDYWTYKTKNTSRPWRKNVRTYIDKLSGYGKISQRYNTYIYVLFMPENCDNFLSAFILENDFGTPMKQHDGDVSVAKNKFIEFLNHTASLSIREQKSGNNEVEI